MLTIKIQFSNINFHILQKNLLQSSLFNYIIYLFFIEILFPQINILDKGHVEKSDTKLKTKITKGISLGVYNHQF